jgi:hypothetical protein
MTYEFVSVERAEKKREQREQRAEDQQRLKICGGADEKRIREQRPERRGLRGAENQRAEREEN